MDEEVCSLLGLFNKQCGIFQAVGPPSSINQNFITHRNNYSSGLF